MRSYVSRPRKGRLNDPHDTNHVRRGSPCKEEQDQQLPSNDGHQLRLGVLTTLNVEVHRY